MIISRISWETCPFSPWLEPNRSKQPESFQFLHMTLQEILGANWQSAIKILL
jgi:hypothetical protein